MTSVTTNRIANILDAIEANVGLLHDAKEDDDRAAMEQTICQDLQTIRESLDGPLTGHHVISLKTSCGGYEEVCDVHVSVGESKIQIVAYRDPTKDQGEFVHSPIEIKEDGHNGFGHEYWLKHTPPALRKNVR